MQTRMRAAVDDVAVRSCQTLNGVVQKKRAESNELHDEFKTFLRETHADNRHRGAACAWLAILLYRDAGLGTYRAGAKYWAVWPHCLLTVC